MNQKIKRLVVSNKLLACAKQIERGSIGMRYCCHVFNRICPELLPFFAEVYMRDAMGEIGLEEVRGFPWWVGYMVSYSEAKEQRIFAILFLRQAILNGMIPLNYKCKSAKK